MLREHPKKVLILVNTLTSINSFVYSNHISFFTQNKINFPNTEFVFLTPHRMSIDMARNFAAKQALALDCDYLMFLDDDVMVPKHTFKQLWESDKDIVAGLVIIRGFPFDVMAFKEVTEKIKIKDPLDETKELEVEKPGLTYYNDLPLKFPKAKEGEDGYGQLEKLVECGAVGFSCCLIHMDVIKAVTPPYFITLPNRTEDVYFCQKVKEELTPTPTIFLNTEVQCGHLMNPEPVEWRFRKDFQDFYFKNFVDSNLNDEEKHRDVNYLRHCIAKLG